MRNIREISLDGRAVQVREMTVGEIRRWLASKTEAGDLVDSLIFEEIALSDLSFLTDLPADVVDGLAPSEIRRVIDAAREVNPDFFAMRERTVALGQRLLAEHGAPA